MGKIVVINPIHPSIQSITIIRSWRDWCNGILTHHARILRPHYTTGFTSNHPLFFLLSLSLIFITQHAASLLYALPTLQNFLISSQFLPKLGHKIPLPIFPNFTPSPSFSLFTKGVRSGSAVLGVLTFTGLPLQLTFFFLGVKKWKLYIT